MRNIRVEKEITQDLPVQLLISFSAVYNIFLKYTSNENKKHPFYSAAIKVKKEIEKYPFLIEGFSDFSLIEKHREIIDLMLEPLFPEILQTNEIKAAMVPFTFKSFKVSSRLDDIIKNAGEDFTLKVRAFSSDSMYRKVCSVILQKNYGFKIDISRPFYFDIPNIETGVEHHYRVNFNGDFIKFIATEKAPKITEDDYRKLLDNYDNIDFWKEKFPPNSYISKGFGLINLFDVTIDQTIAGISAELLSSGDDISDRVEVKLREFFKIKDLRTGFSVYDVSSNNISNFSVKKHESFFLNVNEIINCKGFFCNSIIDSIFHKNEPVTISSVSEYGKNTNYNDFYKQLVTHNIGSLIIVPFRPNGSEDLILIEIMSPRPYELNKANQSKLEYVLPIFNRAIERLNIEYKNSIEAIIQEKYTSIHPTVKWRFIEASEKYQAELLQQKEEVKIDEIIFEEVYPLYGQLDIKGSSRARNKAIQQDLITQLSLAVFVLEKASNTENMPIYKELIYRLQLHLNDVENGLNSGDETLVLNFLKEDIYPVFTHLQTVNISLQKLVSTYTNRLDSTLDVIYEKRKDYEESVTVLNDTLSYFIDKKQKEAQAMFPHYFERYKTDGLDFNMYIGQSLVKDKRYSTLYLHNLRLWQLELMCEMENVALKAHEKMKHKLRVASLILIHSNPLAIKFRMDEKQFDVDGAYNIRYEIIKKRIDKIHIKGTNNRLTVPNKIAIVYSQESEALEYKKYIEYLQSQNKLGVIEDLELENLEGVSGLKALRVEVVYDKNFHKKSSLTFKELVSGFN